MRRTRVLSLVVGGVALAVLLLDWTIGAFDTFRIGRVDDLRRLRAVMRAVDPTTTGREVLTFAPDLEVTVGRGQTEIATDALGARSGPAAAEPAEGLHVLLVGGGAVLGMGVADELTFARSLQTARAPDGRPFVVVNAGQPFFDVADAADLAGYWLGRTDTDVVLLCGPTVDGAPSELLRAIASGVGLERPFWARLLPSLWALQRRISRVDEQQAPSGATPEERALSIERAIGMAAAAGARAIVVDLGSEEFAALCAGRGWSIVDAGFTDEELQSPVFSDPAEGWPGAFGHDRIHQHLVEGLVQLGVIADPAGG